MTSPCLIEPRAQSVGLLTLSLRNRTDPSSIKTLAPPGWKLLKAYEPTLSMVPPPSVLQSEPASGLNGQRCARVEINMPLVDESAGQKAREPASY
jgi:hypothetical protein